MQWLNADIRILIGRPQVQLLDVSKVLDRRRVASEKRDLPTAALEKAVRDACVVLQDEQAPLEDELADRREIAPVEEVGTRFDERRHRPRPFEKPVEGRLFGKSLVFKIAGEIINAPRRRVPRPEVIDLHSIRPARAFRQLFIRGLYPNAASVGNEAPDVDDGVSSPLQEEADDGQGPFHLAACIDVHHVHGDEIAALEETRDERSQVGKEFPSPLRGCPLEIGQVADRLEAHQDGLRGPGKEREGRGKIRPAEGVKEGGRILIYFPEVLSRPGLHWLKDGRIEFLPRFPGESGEFLPRRVLKPGRVGRRLHGQAARERETVVEGAVDGRRRRDGERGRRDGTSGLRLTACLPPADGTGKKNGDDEEDRPPYRRSSFSSFIHGNIGLLSAFYGGKESGPRGGRRESLSPPLRGLVQAALQDPPRA